MSACRRARTPGREPDSTGHAQEESRDEQLLPVKHQNIPPELMVSLTSTGAAHHRHCQGFDIRRPDPVWHHPRGRSKYRYFLEQPTSLTGAGRDISFLCDAVVTQRKVTPLPPVNQKNEDTQSLSISGNVIPEEYHIIKNKGIRCLELYEDAFTVQLKDQEQRLRVLPSLRPSGRLEVLQLMRMMDDMLEKAGVDEQSEELTEFCQLEGLLKLVKVEQNIYNTVFHEVVRQVTVGCAERGQLLAKLRQRYQSLLNRIPHRLKGLHSKAVAQRALDRRLTEEIYHIKASMQQINMELSKIRDQDTFVCQQVEQADQELSEALKPTHIFSDYVQGYHKLYELQRARLETQLLQMTEELDCWRQFALHFALNVIRVKKLHLVSQLHVCEEDWFKTADHFLSFLSSADTEDLHEILELTDCWKEQLLALMFQLKETEDAQCAQITATQQGIAKWFSFLNTQNKYPDPKYDKTTVKEIHTDLRQWSEMAVQFEECQSKKQLLCQQKLRDLSKVLEKWLLTNLQLFERHPSSDAEVPGGQQTLRELDKVLSELLKQLDIQVSDDSGIRRLIMSLVRLMEPWVDKTAAVVEQSKRMAMSDWLQLEEALCEWQSLAEEVLLHFNAQKENNKDKKKPDLYRQTQKVLGDLQDFTSSLSDFTEHKNHKLREDVASFHMAQTRWMLDLLLVMLPDQSEKQNLVQKPDNVTLQTLEEDAKVLSEKLLYFSSFITRSCISILEEKVRLDFNKDECENEMNECKNLQRESVDWVETCQKLLTGIRGGPAELPDIQHAPSITADPADSMETQVSKRSSLEPGPDVVKDRGTEPDSEEGQPAAVERPVVKLMGFDGNITEKSLGENRVPLTGTDEPVVSPDTEEAQRAFNDLTTVIILQQDLNDTEARAKRAEQRALKAEEALQAALEKIQELESKQESQPCPKP